MRHKIDLYQKRIKSNPVAQIAIHAVGLFIAILIKFYVEQNCYYVEGTQLPALYLLVAVSKSFLKNCKTFLKFLQITLVTK